MRKSIRFNTYLRSDANNEGAAFIMEVEASQKPPCQISLWPCSMIYFCLSGRGKFVIKEGGELKHEVIGPMSLIRIPANTPHIIRNELRDVWKLYAVLEGVTGAEGFLDVFSVKDETVWQETADAFPGIELYLPEPEPEPVAAIVAAENRIHWPMGAGFGF